MIPRRTTDRMIAGLLWGLLFALGQWLGCWDLSKPAQKPRVPHVRPASGRNEKGDATTRVHPLRPERSR